MHKFAFFIETYNGSATYLGAVYFINFKVVFMDLNTRKPRMDIASVLAILSVENIAGANENDKGLRYGNNKNVNVHKRGKAKIRKNSNFK